MEPANPARQGPEQVGLRDPRILSVEEPREVSPQPRQTLSPPEGKAWWMSGWPLERTPGPHLPLHPRLAACSLRGRLCGKS